MFKLLYKAEFSKFIITGAVNTLIGYFVFVSSYFFFKNEIIALFLTYTIGIFINYKMYSLHVFNKYTSKKFFNFLLVYVGVFFLNISILRLLEFNLYFSQFLAILIVTPILYFLNKRYVFTNKKVMV